MQPSAIQALIQNQIPDAKVTIASSDNIHYHATVISAKFKGLSKLNQHRLVYNALREELKAKIHALQLTTKTPEESTV
tara:strand:+ start:128 stop:361 length:234 start_codon:yes stop_codon:yes gene_type:complete